MMKKFSAVLALLTLLSFSSVGAEEITVKVASDRAAVLNLSDTNPANPNVSGSLKGSADFKAGKSAIDGMFEFKNSPESQEAKGSFYSKASGSSVEAIGYVDAKLPPDPDMPKAFKFNFETVTEGDQLAADFKFDFTGPNEGGAQVPTGNGDMQFDGDMKAFKSSGKFSLSGGDIKAAEAPFKSFNLEITEVENKTTISIEIKVPKASEMAPQLDMIPAMSGQIENQLKQVGLQYENLEFPAPTEEGDLKVGKAKLTLIDLRGTLKPFIGMAANQMQGELGPDVDAAAAFNNMLELKMDKVAFNLNVEETDKLDGTFEVNLSQMDKFFNGYVVILPAVQQQSNREAAREIAREMGPAGQAFQPFLEAVLSGSTKQGVDSIKAAVASTLSMSGNMEFTLAPKEQDVVFTMGGNVLAKNYKDYVAKAKEAGIAVPEKAVAKIDFDLKDSSQLVGNLYLYSDGDLLKYYQGIFADSAKTSNAPPEVVKELEGFELKDMVFRADLDSNKLTVKGSSETSDLTGISKLIMSQAQIAATVTGAGVDVNMPAGEQANADLKVFFSEFLPGKNEAQIKEALGLPASAQVSVDASADDVKLVAVAAPDVTVDGKLAEVQSSGQQLLASSPADIGGGSGGGGNNWGLIALGALLLVGVGGFLMFGKK